MKDLLKALDELIDTVGGNKVIPCWKIHGDVPCIKYVKAAWGGPLSNAQYGGMCDACRAYWHLAAARNDIAVCIRRAVDE